MCAADAVQRSEADSLRGRADANNAEVAAKGGIDAVLAAMRRHERVAAVAEKGCGALQIMSYYSGGRSAACLRAGGVCIRVHDVVCVFVCVCACGWVCILCGGM